MKLKTYNRSNCQNARSANPKISLMKSGAISFSRPAAEMIGLELGDRVEFVQDEENKRDWYITKSKEDDAFILRGKNDEKNPYLMVASGFICNKIKQELELSHIETPVRFLIGKESFELEGNVYWAILTINPIYAE